MDSPSKKNIAKYLIIALLVCTFIGGAAWFVIAEKDKAEKDKNVKETQTIGVINYEQLVPEHPDFVKLEELDKQIASLDNEPIDQTKLRKVSEDLKKKMSDYQKQLESLLAQEQARIKQESNAKANALQGKMDSTLRAKKIEMLKYKEQLEKEYSKSQKSSAKKAPSSFEKEFQKRLQVKANDLLSLKEHQIAAKAMELSKKSQEKLMTRKSGVDQKVAAYEEEIRAQNQTKKIDLRLKLQTAKSDEEREAVQKQLEQLFSEESSLVEAKRKELYTDVRSLEKEEVAKNDAILRKFKARLDADVNRQLSGVKNKIASEMASQGISGAIEDVSIPKEYRDKLAAKQKEIQAEMSSLQAKLKTEMEEISKTAQAQFETRKKMIIDKLQSYQGNLAKEFDRKRNEMVKELHSSKSEKNKARHQLIIQRKNTYEMIIEDINAKVKAIAKAKSISFVVGTYVSNVNAVDLSDDARNAIQADKKAKGISPSCTPTPAATSSEPAKTSDKEAKKQAESSDNQKAPASQELKYDWKSRPGEKTKGNSKIKF
jgi:hypothetical protein